MRKILIFIAIMEVPILYFSGLSHRPPDRSYSEEASHAVTKACISLEKRLALDEAEYLEESRKPKLIKL